MEIRIDPRYNGPPGSGNGGYTCGLVASLLGVPAAEVTLRLPPPLGVALRWDGGRLLDGDEVVAEGGPAELELALPGPVSLEEAEAASRRYPGFERHAFPTCFVCGPERRPGDGLRIFAGPVEGRELVAAPWTPDEATPELVWAALDCPGAYALEWSGREELLLGRLRARVDRIPVPGEPCVVVGWPIGVDRRKLYAGTALFTAADGEPLAAARATWIRPRRQRVTRIAGGAGSR